MKSGHTHISDEKNHVVGLDRQRGNLPPPFPCRLLRRTSTPNFRSPYFLTSPDFSNMRRK